jgi:hypothetical protein
MQVTEILSIYNFLWFDATTENKMSVFSASVDGVHTSMCKQKITVNLATMPDTIKLITIPKRIINRKFKKV